MRKVKIIEELKKIKLQIKKLEETQNDSKH